MNYCLIETLLWMTILAPFGSALPTQEASKGSAIILHVVDQAGGSVPSADVHLVPFPTGLNEGLMTDPDGNLLLELPPGDYNVTVKAPAFFPASKLIKIERDSRQTIQIVLKAESCPPGPCVPVTSKEETKGAVPFAVVVVYPNWGAVPKAQIKLQPTVSPKILESNELGEISLDVPPGSYDLFVTNPDFVPWAKNIRVGANMNERVTVVLQPIFTTTLVQLDRPCVPAQNDDDDRKSQRVCSASLTISVTDAAGAAIPSAQIGGLPGAIFERTAAPRFLPSDFYETDESGKFSLKLDPGQYEISVTSPSFRRCTKRIELKDKENQTVTVVLQAWGHVVTGLK